MNMTVYNAPVLLSYADNYFLRRACFLQRTVYYIKSVFCTVLHLLYCTMLTLPFYVELVFLQWACFLQGWTCFLQRDCFLYSLALWLEPCFSVLDNFFSQTPLFYTDPGFQLYIILFCAGLLLYIKLGLSADSSSYRFLPRKSISTGSLRCTVRVACIST
jgi:hypothetical protein